MCIITAELSQYKLLALDNHQDDSSLESFSGPANAHPTEQLLNRRY